MIDDGHKPKKAKCGPKCKAKKLWNKNLDCPYLWRGIPGWCDEFRKMSPEAQGAIAATLTAAPVGVAAGLACMGGGCEAALAASPRFLSKYFISFHTTKMGGSVITIGHGLIRYVGPHAAKLTEEQHRRQIELLWRKIVWRF